MVFGLVLAVVLVGQDVDHRKVYDGLDAKKKANILTHYDNALRQNLYGKRAFEQAAKNAGVDVEVVKIAAAEQRKIESAKFEADKKKQKERSVAAKQAENDTFEVSSSYDRFDKMTTHRLHLFDKSSSDEFTIVLNYAVADSGETSSLGIGAMRLSMKFGDEWLFDDRSVDALVNGRPVDTGNSRVSYDSMADEQAKKVRLFIRKSVPKSVVVAILGAGIMELRFGSREFKPSPAQLKAAQEFVRSYGIKAKIPEALKEPRRAKEKKA